MRAVVCQQEGPVEDLVVEERPAPEPGPGQVVVDVEAAGVNYVDALFVRGEYQIKPPTPFVPGSEIAGTVRALGDGVDGVAVGDRVLAMCGLGAYAEQVAVPAAAAVPLPDALDAPRAAALVQSYCTALYAFRRAPLREGERVLVLGAAGGVGRAAIDVAVALGASVVAVSSSDERLAACLAAGAEAAVNHRTEDLKVRLKELAPDGFDVVVDPVGGDLSEVALRRLGDDGRLLVIGFAGGGIPAIPLNLVLLRNRRVVGVDWGAWMLRHALEQRALLDEVLTMVAEGRLHPPAPTAYPLAEAGIALADLLANRVGGKAVLVP